MDMANGAEPQSMSGQKAQGFEQDTDLDGGWDDEPAPASVAPPPTIAARSSGAPGASVAPYRPSVGAPAPAALSALVAEVAAKSPSTTPVPIALTITKSTSVAPRPNVAATGRPPSVAPRTIALTTPRTASVAPKPAPAITPETPPVTIGHKAASPSPVSAAPRPRSYTPPPPPAEPVSKKANADLEAPAAAAVPTPAVTPSIPKSTLVQAPPVEAVRAFAAQAEDAGTLRPSEVEPPVIGTRRRSVARLVAALGIAAAIVLASVAWLKDDGRTVRSQLQRVLAPAAQPQPQPAALPASPEPPRAEAKPSDAQLAPGAVITAVEPAPSAPEAALAPPPPAPTTAAEGAPTLSGAVAATLAKAGSTHVTVKTVPAGAAIFQAGKRLGTGLVELDVEPKMKHRLTALMDGHRPVNFTVDGSRDTVTIMLKPVPRVVAPKPEPTTTTDGSAETTAQKPAEAPAPEPAATTESAKPDPFAAP